MDSKKANKKRSSINTQNPVPAQGKLDFDYIKSNFFRVVKVDGVHGGIVPNGRAIQIAFFNERQPIPRKETYKIEKGHVGEKTGAEIRCGVVREVEFEAILDIDTAVVIHKWLEEKIKMFQDISRVKE